MYLQVNRISVPPVTLITVVNGPADAPWSIIHETVHVNVFDELFDMMKLLRQINNYVIYTELKCYISS